MMGLAWTNQLSVGNAIIDSEHQVLLNMVNDVERAIRKSDCFALSQAFKLLENWLCIHFANEEKIAQAINFPFDRHKLAQQFSLKELQYMKEELAAKDGLWSERAMEHYSNFLKNWVVDDHIVKFDMLMKSALQKHPYDFLPG
ncbi:MAG: hypothetical protein EPN14_04130 [Gallionella sp.]|nr:MAG: hypothetical protein EPN14_04130 [Gallionella sp.]